MTASYIDSLVGQITPGIRSIVPGLKDEHVRVAGDYLKAQVRKTWASDFLTTDLMPHLENLDGSHWVKSAL